MEYLDRLKESLTKNPGVNDTVIVRRSDLEAIIGALSSAEMAFQELAESGADMAESRDRADDGGD